MRELAAMNGMKPITGWRPLAAFLKADALARRLGIPVSGTLLEQLLCIARGSADNSVSLLLAGKRLFKSHSDFARSTVVPSFGMVAQILHNHGYLLVNSDAEGCAE